MKLILAIINDDDGHAVMRALTKKSYIVTKIATTGGFLKTGNTTLLIGTDNDVQEVIDIIKTKCSSRKRVIESVPLAITGLGNCASIPYEVNVGGAVVFVMDVERFEKV